MIAGPDTYISHLLELSGLKNAARQLSRSDLGRYPEVQMGALSSLRPDLLLLSSEPYPFRKRDLSDFEPLQKQNPQMSVLKIDGQLMSWWGSLAAESLEFLHAWQGGHPPEKFLRIL